MVHSQSDAHPTAGDSTSSGGSPLVSVVIPAYDRVSLCREAVASARKAVRGIHAEIIVMDDASPQPLRDELPADVLVERIPRSGMPGHVRNEGVERAGGELVAFLDSDDIWHEQKLSTQLARLGRDRAERASDVAATGRARMIHCRERWLRDGTELSQKGQRHRRRGDIFEDAVVKCIVGPSTFAVERRLFVDFGGYRPDLEIAEDYELMLRMLAFEPIEYVDEPLVDKRDHAGPQLSHSYGHIEGFRIRGLGDVLADMLCARAQGESQDRLQQPPTRQAVAAIDAVTRIHAGSGQSSSGSGHTPPGSRHSSQAELDRVRSFRTRWGVYDPAGIPRARVLTAAREYARKCGIFARGAAKRGRTREAEVHSQASELVEGICEDLAEERAAR